MGRSICPVPNCKNFIASKLCATHLGRLKKGLPLDAPVKPWSSQKGRTCPNHPDRPARTQGLCRLCWVRSYRRGKRRVVRFDPILGKQIETYLALEDTALAQMLADIPKPIKPEPEEEPKPKAKRLSSPHLPGVGSFPTRA